VNNLKQSAYNLLRKSEGWFKTDMVYITKSGFWLTANQAISVAVGLGLSIAYANLIDPTSYGIFKYVLSFAAILSIFSLPGLNPSYSQAVARGNEGNINEILNKKLITSLFGSALSLVIAGYYLFKGNIVFSSLFATTACFIPIFNTYNITDFYLQGKKFFKQTAYYSLIKSIVTTLVIILSLLITHNIIIITLVYFFIWSIINFWVFYNIKTRYGINNKTEIGVVEYGKHLTYIGIIPIISQYIDRILIFQFLGPMQLAGYNFAISIPDQIRSYAKNFQSMASPVLASTTSKDIWHKIKHKLFFMTIILIGMTLLYFFVAPILFKILFSKYTDYVNISRFYGLTIIFSAASLPFLALQAKEVRLALYQFNTIKSVFQILFLVLFLWLWGLYGVILSRILTELLSLALGVILSKRHLS